MNHTRKSFRQANTHFEAGLAAGPRMMPKVLNIWPYAFVVRQPLKLSYRPAKQPTCTLRILP